MKLFGTVWWVALSFAAVSSLMAQDLGIREWKTADGGKTLRAEYVNSRDGKVTIRREADRKVFTIPLTSLAEADQKWVEAREAEMTAKAENGKEKEASEEFSKLITGEWERSEGHGLKYRFFADRELRRSKDGGFPLLVYLHGRGGDVMTRDRPGEAATFSSEANYGDRPCFILVPQNPDQMGWNGVKADGVVEIVKEMVKNLPVDENRIYVAGFSMGGYGTFHLLAQEPDLFAAGVPVAGGGNPGSAKDFKEVPVWVFHGAQDPTVKVEQSQRMVEALKEEKAEVKYTEYPDGNHGIIGRVMADKEMHQWLFEQRKK